MKAVRDNFAPSAEEVTITMYSVEAIELKFILLTVMQAAVQGQQVSEVLTPNERKRFARFARLVSQVATGNDRTEEVQLHR